MKKRLWTAVVLFFSLYLIVSPTMSNANSFDPAITNYSIGDPEWKPN